MFLFSAIVKLERFIVVPCLPDFEYFFSLDKRFSIFTMTVFSNYNRSKVKKRSSGTIYKAKITKNTIASLLLVHYNLFLSSLLKEANSETRNHRSKITKGEHIKAVAKRVLKKYQR